MSPTILFLLAIITQSCSQGQTEEVDRQEIPIIMNNREFFEKYLIKPPDLSDTSEASFFGESASLTAFAPCALKEVAVAVPDHTTPSLYYWPTHVSLKRCLGGCPISVKYACKSTVQMVNINLLVMKKVGEKFEKVGGEVVEMPDHVRCACSCGQLPADCKPSQQYNANQCLCQCKEQSSCETGKVWQNDACKCACRTLHECPDGEVFSFNSCRCIGDPSMETSGEFDQTALQKICPQLLCPPPQKLSLSENPCVCKFS